MPRLYTVLLPCPLSVNRKTKLEAMLAKIPAINRMIIGLTVITLVLYR